MPQSPVARALLVLGLASCAPPADPPPERISRPGEYVGYTDPAYDGYERTSAYGHFGRDDFSWERTDKAELLASAAGLS